MSSRVVVLAAILLASGVGAALYLLQDDDPIERADRTNAGATREGPQASRERTNAAAVDDESGTRSDEGEPPPLRALAEILSSLESRGDDDPTRIRKDLRDLQAYLASVRGAVDRASRQRIVRLLTTLEPKWRAHAGVVIGELQPDPDTVHALLEMLGTEGLDESALRGALNALATMPAEDASAPLLALLGQNRVEEPQIIRAIARIGNPEAMRQLVAWLDRPIQPATRLQIEKALTLEAGSDALDEAMKNLRTATSAKRKSLLLVVSRIGGEHYGEAVRRALLQGLEPVTHQAAIRALGAIGDPESGRVLWSLAQSEDPEEAAFALRALTRIRNRETLDLLINEAAAIPLGTQRALLEAGSSIRRPGPALLDLADRLLASEDKPTRVTAIAVTGASRKPRFIPALAELYGKRRDTATRAAIFDALWDMQQRESTRTALALLEETPQGELRELNLKRFKRRAGLRPEDAPR